MPVEPSDRIVTAPAPARPRAQVLLLHGGAQHGQVPVDGRSLAVHRTRAMLRAVAPRLTDAGVAVSMLRFTVKGWNGTRASPVDDVRWAVAALRAEHPDLPVVLLGHSMGARASAWAADAPGVVGVVGLAPWFPKDDPVGALAGKHLVAAHGGRDRITSPRHTRRFVERATDVAASARYVEMGSLGHYMLRGAGHWNDVAVTETLDILDRVRGHEGTDVGGITLPE
ncbi:alpha/beta hydrolase [Marmoricola sp. RAF53]|uniref:alpha/beta hydrolase n=1 Tax=Marmoricola sp. RAF53 TaxID=3233059 RepID=UPI003F97A9A9